MQKTCELLQVDPSNREAKQLEALVSIMKVIGSKCENSSLQVSKRLHEDGVKGAAVAGGAALALGGLVGLGLAIAKAVRKRGEKREEE